MAYVLGFLYDVRVMDERTDSTLLYVASYVPRGRPAKRATRNSMYLEVRYRILISVFMGT